MGDFNPTESRYRGERRPMPFFKNVGGKNSVFSPSSFTDKRQNSDGTSNTGYNQSYMFNMSSAGSYASSDIDSAVYGSDPATRVRNDKTAQESYNKAYGPGASGSRPPLDNARNKLAKRNQNLMNSRRNKGV